MPFILSKESSLITSEAKATFEKTLHEIVSLRAKLIDIGKEFEACYNDIVQSDNTNLTTTYLQIYRLLRTADSKLDMAVHPLGFLASQPEKKST